MVQFGELKIQEREAHSAKLDFTCRLNTYIINTLYTKE